MLSDQAGIFGSSMSDSTRAMVTEATTRVLVVIYCFEDAIDLDALLNRAKDAFTTYAGAQHIDCWSL